MVLIMRYGVVLPNFGDYFDPRILAELARDAERVGWDGFFLWDHVLLWPTPTVDPWVALTAVALRTSRIRLGTLVTPVPRRRPVKLAREAVSLDHLSDGRLILGVGIGNGPWEWDYLRESSDLKLRGAMLDEALELLTQLWSGRPVLHEGPHYSFRGDHGPDDPRVSSTPFLPPSRQQPRIPIWVAGVWPNRPPFRRAARWDGVVPNAADRDFGEYLTPSELSEVVAYIGQHRLDTGPIDIVASGHTAGKEPDQDAAAVRAFAEAGATWWIEDVSPWPFGWQWEGPWPIERMNDRIRQGPPQFL